MNENEFECSRSMQRWRQCLNCSLLVLFVFLGAGTACLGILIHGLRELTTEQRRIITNIEASGGRVFSTFGGTRLNEWRVGI